jgi:hypothetical protein
MVALANASSSHVRSRRSSPAADDEAVDADEEKGEKEDEEAVPDELAVKQADDAHVDASPLLLDSVSETAAVAAAAADMVRVSGSSEQASESAAPSAGGGGAGTAAGGEDFFFFLPFFLDCDGFIAPVAVASPWAFPFPYRSPLRLGVSRARGGFDLPEKNFSRGGRDGDTPRPKRNAERSSHADSRRETGGRRRPGWAHVEWPCSMSCGVPQGWGLPVMGESRKDGSL